MDKMELFNNNVEHYTPPIEKLTPFKQIKCSQYGCNNIFTNQSNFEMHLIKHHRVQPISSQKSSLTRQFYCPESNCTYQFGKEKGKHFKNLKYLRQHYQKCHLAKDFVCENCDKAFFTIDLLKKHQKDLCGKIYECFECGWIYYSLEALLTHGKRKGHKVELNKTFKKVPIMKKVVNDMRLKRTQEDLKEPVKDSATKLLEHGEMEATATESSAPPQTLCSTQMSAGVQTDSFSEMSDTSTTHDISSALDEIHSLLRDIETQTEPFMSVANANQTYLDQMLAQSSHMYTQTCDDFLSELGLADIQTQTHWPSPQRDHEEKLQFTSTATSTNPCIHDELLVSTETQTSFTQCLLNSCTDTGTSTPVSFGSLYHTQHTQTCDPLLESFDFEGHQTSDLMDGFQSTYTQT